MARGWSEELRHEVGRLLRDGLSPAEIAPLVGKTRNAICGMVFRDPVLGAAQQERLAKMSHGDRTRHFFRKKEALPVPTPPVSLKPAAYNARALMIRLIELAPSQCRFPVTHDREHLFCGHARWNANIMYCEHHARRCVASRA